MGWLLVIMGRLLVNGLVNHYNGLVIGYHGLVNHYYGLLIGYHGWVFVLVSLFLSGAEKHKLLYK